MRVCAVCVSVCALALLKQGEAFKHTTWASLHAMPSRYSHGVCLYVCMYGILSRPIGVNIWERRNQHSFTDRAPAKHAILPRSHIARACSYNAREKRPARPTTHGSEPPNEILCLLVANAPMHTSSPRLNWRRPCSLIPCMLRPPRMHAAASGTTGKGLMYTYLSLTRTCMQVWPIMQCFLSMYRSGGSAEKALLRCGCGGPRQHAGTQLSCLLIVTKHKMLVYRTQVPSRVPQTGRTGANDDCSSAHCAGLSTRVCAWIFRVGHLSITCFGTPQP